jgi:hypothetical protein
MTDKTLNTVDQWIAVLVEVLKDHGRPMREDAAIKLTAKICKVSPARMPFVVNSAVSDGLIVRDGSSGTLALP